VSDVYDDLHAPHPPFDERKPIRIVSAWPDGVCCGTCRHWSEYDMGQGQCEGTRWSDNARIIDGGTLTTAPTFACTNWEAK
jgi:hypothetical protein